MNIMLAMHIGKRIARARKRAGITPDELATLLGITGAAVRSWELGKSQPRPSRYDDIATALGANPNYIAREIEPVMMGDDPDELEQRASAFADLMATLSDDQIDLVIQVAREFQKAP